VREFFQQAAERLNKSNLIAVTVRVHPLLAVMAAEILEKLKRFAGEDSLCGKHGMPQSFRLIHCVASLRVHDSKPASIGLCCEACPMEAIVARRTEFLNRG
jgi:hypothetical protein